MTAVLGTPVQAQSDATWSDSIELYLGSTSEPDDLTGCTADVHLRARTGSPTPIVLNEANGLLGVTLPNVIAWSAPLGPDGQSVAPGAYDCEARVFRTDGSVQAVLAWVASFVKGASIP